MQYVALMLKGKIHLFMDPILFVELSCYLKDRLYDKRCISWVNMYIYLLQFTLRFTCCAFTPIPALNFTIQGPYLT